MAATFVSASTQYLTNASPPVTAPPFTVGLWALPTSTGVFNTLWYLGASTDDNSWWIRQFNTDVWSFACRAASAAADQVQISTITSGQWHFLLYRVISATNRRCSVLRYDGQIDHGQGTASNSPSGTFAMKIGARETSGAPYNGSVAEFWCANADVQADGGQIDNSLLHKLAYGGPFSVPHVAANVVEYRSFRKAPASDTDEAAEVYSGRFGRQTWTNTGGVSTGPHLALPYWYTNPTDYFRTEIV